MSYDCEFINYLIIYNYLNVCLLKLRELYLQIFSIVQLSRNSFIVQATSAFPKFVFLDFSQHLNIQTLLERFYIPIFFSAPLLFKNSFIGRTIDHQASKNLSTISSAYPRIAISIDRSGCYNSKGPALEWCEKRSGGTKASERRRQTESRLAKKKQERRKEKRKKEGKNIKNGHKVR